MSIIDRDLVRTINSGQCFAIIGSGPSCQMGVCSWKELAKNTIENINKKNKETRDIKDCRIYLEKEDYPMVFSIAEKVLGQEELLDIVKKSLAAEKSHSSIYDYAAMWPFPCYLTTNFDDYLQLHLERLKETFLTKLNSKEDMQFLRADSKGLIVKIHGDTSVPKDIVLTKEQYEDFRNGDDREYWREKIKAALHMISFVIIGYSVSDPDFKEQLERAKELSSPDHPVFMFAADMERDEIAQYYQNFNIRVIRYENKDGKHQELLSLLKRYDPFIAKRNSSDLGLKPIDEEEAGIAASMHLFTKLRLEDTAESCIEKTYASVILNVLYEISENKEIEIKILQSLLKKKTFATSHIDPVALQQALERMYSNGLIILNSNQSTVRLTQYGRSELSKTVAERDFIREKFKLTCKKFLIHEYSHLNKNSIENVINALEIGLVAAYEKRGMEIARSVFSDSQVDISGASDILDTINRASSHLKEYNERASFADLMLEVILRPEKEMKEYLAVLSQGYFAFHALGLDPRCSKERLDIAKKKIWILDSSILLPILAIGCENHNYAKDLLKRMSDIGLHFCTTERLFYEIRDHAGWAISNFGNVLPDAPLFLQAATAGPGFKHNLFLEGFVKWSLSEGAPSFHQYMIDCFDSEYPNDWSNSIRKKIIDLGIEIKDFSEWLGFDLESWSERDVIVHEIEALRKYLMTYRSEAQCIAEAEVVFAAETQDAAFLSQSGILNRLNRTKPGMSWKPEAMYRFLSFFSSVPSSIDMLFNCMIQDFYYAGFDIIDKQVISQFVQPMVKQARLKLEKESTNYKQALGKKQFDRLKDGFERVPDEQKPFYSMQFAFLAADKAIIAAQRTTDQERETARKSIEAAKARVDIAERTKKLTEKEKKELEILKRKDQERKKKAKKKQRRLQSQPKRKKRNK
jgi:hypothetical protein